MKYILVAALLLQGCVALPPAIEAVVTIGSTTKTIYDVNRIVEDKPTSNDEIMSEILDKECKTSNIFRGEDYCEIDLELDYDGE